MIYFDNAASSFYKPYLCTERAVYAMRELSVNAGRSGHKLSEQAERLIYSARSTTSSAFNNGSVQRVIFTANCTQALNFAIFGIERKKRKIVTTVTEHNSVLRPLYQLEKSGYKLVIANLNEKQYICADDVINLVDDETAFVAVNAVSNVTGAKNEYEKIGLSLKGSGIPFIVDGAQAAGHVRIDMRSSNINCLAVAGHKGLNSIQGAGALIFDENVEISPIIFGGSGNETFEKVPSCYPEKLEAGTRDLPAISSFEQGVKSSAENITERGNRLIKLTAALIRGLDSIYGVKTYSVPNPFGICAFEISAFPSVDAARAYSELFSIAVRGGFHCAPLMHEALKTDENGLIRASLSTYNTAEEVNDFLTATEYLAKHADKLL